MQLKRVKLLSSFRGLPEGYEINFNPSSKKEGAFEPICFVGLNGSGKSNLLEFLSEVFYYLETYQKSDKKHLNDFKNYFCFEIEYFLPQIAFKNSRKIWDELSFVWERYAHDPFIRIIKNQTEYPIISAIFKDKEIMLSEKEYDFIDSILPKRVIAYSSGMNELISNPFIKIDFDYLQDFKKILQSPLEMNRLFFMNYDSNNLITICNFLFDSKDFEFTDFTSGGTTASDLGGINLEPLKKELGINDLKSFSINIKNIKLKDDNSLDLPSELVLAIEKLKRCATFYDETTITRKKEKYNEYKFYFWVNKATKEAFRDTFNHPFILYRQLYFLKLLNLNLISNDLQKRIKSLDISANLSDILPKHEAEKLAFSINDLKFIKSGKEVTYKQLSDGEHQLLQVIGTLLLMDTEGTLFILDEPETHLNPEWRAKFVSLLNESVTNSSREQDIILTSHSPFIVSDCKRERVFIFEKGQDPYNPKINTSGTSVSILTEEIFGKTETISELSIIEIERLRKLPLNTLEDIQIAKEKSRILGESPEKVLLFRELILKENEIKNAQKL